MRRLPKLEDRDRDDDDRHHDHRSNLQLIPRNNG
jgi:hypothetical protein